VHASEVRYPETRTRNLSLILSTNKWHNNAPQIFSNSLSN
jgi:hypothetical protein